MKLIVIDNYDSFTFNLVQRLGELDPHIDIEVHRNDQISIDELKTRQPSHVILSPGPCTPDEAGISVDCVRRCVGEIPILGVCLGHQSIGQALGARIVRAQELMHGKTDHIRHDGRGIFSGLPEPLIATRYHSLVIEPESLPNELEVSAWCDMKDGNQVIMGIRHRTFPLFGVQFHPESFLSDDGPQLLANFLKQGKV